MRFLSSLPSNISDYLSGFSYVDLSDDNKIELQLSPKDDYLNDIDSYDRFCQNMKNFDEETIKHEQEIFRALLESGYIQSESYSKYQKFFSDDEEESLNLQNFQYSEDFNYFYSDFSPLFKINPDDTELVDKVTNIDKYVPNSLLDRYITKVLYKIYREANPPKENSEQMKFKSFFESTETGTVNNLFNAEVAFSRINTYDPKIETRVEIKFKNLNDEAFGAIEYFDDILKHIQNILLITVGERLGIKDKRITELKPVYKKYL
jgi:hypothetical protein